MGVLVSCKSEDDPIKIEGGRVVTTLYIDVIDSHGQLNPQSKVGAGWYSNSSKFLWLSSLPARIKKIQ